MFRLANENAIKEIQNKMRDIQKENDELASSLKKKERECEVKIEETVKQFTSDLLSYKHILTITFY